MLKTLKMSALVFAAFLAACSSVPPVAQESDKTGVALDEVLNEQSSAKIVRADAKPAPAVMSGPALSMQFTGEARTLLKQVAAARGMTFKVLGPQPHLPLFVLIDAKSVSLEDFLVDVGSQMGQRADVVLTANSIEVHYRGN